MVIVAQRAANVAAAPAFVPVALAKVFRPGSTVQVMPASLGLESDLLRIGVVQPPSTNPELADQMRVLLSGDRAIRRFFPEQLEALHELTDAQAATLKEWTDRGWATAPVCHPLQLNEVCYSITLRCLGWIVFVANDGAQQTEPQRSRINEWRAEGWAIAIESLAHGTRLELAVRRTRSGLCDTQLLSSAGWAALMPTLPKSHDLEADLKALEAEENDAIAAGGMQWSTAWKGVSIQDYSVAKKGRNGLQTNFYYHRLESHSPVFPARRAKPAGKESGSPFVKRLHLPHDEYARYRAAKYRYDAKQELLKQIGKPSIRQVAPSAENLPGGWEIFDSRNSYKPGCYPHRTFRLTVYCQGDLIKSFKEIPIDNPLRIERGYAHARRVARPKNLAQPINS